MLQPTDEGLYCPAGDFHIDPWKPVPRAVVTHGHADHLRWGCGSYLVSRPGEGVCRTRLGANAAIRSIDYGAEVTLNGVKVSLHPAGHILGSAQVRVEHKGEVWCVSGDYKIEPDSTCTPWEPVRCHTFITESTFGLPIYRWPAQSEVFAAINGWWRSNQSQGKTSVLYGYALGKAQRLLAGLDPSIGPIYTHGAVEKLNVAYRDAGVALPPTELAGGPKRGFDWSRGMVIAPPSAGGTPWLRKFGHVSNGFASGWMAIRGTRRRRAVDRGFVLSDHIDWPGLQTAIRATGAERVQVTHGYTAVVVRWLREQGLQADVLATRYEGEDAGGTDEAGAEPDAAGSDASASAASSIISRPHSQ